VPDNPIIPFIEGDGTGRDIWKASQRVFDAAVEKAYGGKRAIRWFEIFAGEKAFRQFNTWLPDDSVAAARDCASPSRDRSPRPSAAASARSTWPCARFSTSTPASARSSTTRACPAR
jgi:hypothetical protein